MTTGNRLLGNHSLPKTSDTTGASEMHKRRVAAELASAEYTRRVEALLARGGA